MLADGVEKEVWLIKSRADLVSDVTWVVLQDRTKYVPLVASPDFSCHQSGMRAKGSWPKEILHATKNRTAHKETL